ncbi:phosphoglycerate dehydrogenase [Methanobacterium sp. ACI-7]|uniref:phosphoglycerate dehydrogenase n=1 Tax=unclassified Methanobacterium TaxID=2627676 RepID=UPI0039C38B79
MSQKVIIADQINEKGIEDLKEVAEVVVDTAITQEELINKIKDFDAIIVRSRTKVTRDVIEAAEKLKIIARAGVGVDNVDVEAATEKGIMVVNAPESTSITVAEHAFGLIMSLARKISIADKSVKEGKWEKGRFMGMELYGKTLGIIGMGRIGTQVAIRAKAFGMDIMVYDPYITEEAGAELGVTVVELDYLLRNSDVMTIHVPLTPETKHLIAAKEFEIMKENAIIVNCARGGIINEEDLYDALKEGQIAGAGLDVFEQEPPEGSSLLELDNLVATPHIGASTKEAQRDAAIIVANEVKKVLTGEAPKNVLNMPVLDPETFQAIKPYLQLSEKLANFLIQAAKGNITEVDITYCGELADFPRKDVLSRTVLKETLNSILTEPVNMINAPTVAKNRGIIITESKRSEAEGYKSLIKVKIKSDEGELSIEGTATKEPRIVRIDEYWVNVKPKGTMVITRYKDIPGSIGTIGTKLGEHGINIAKMQVGRQEPGGEAVMVLTVDQKVPSEVIDEIRDLEHVYDAVYVQL